MIKRSYFAAFVIYDERGAFKSTNSFIVDLVGWRTDTDAVIKSARDYAVKEIDGIAHMIAFNRI